MSRHALSHGINTDISRDSLAVAARSCAGCPTLAAEKNMKNEEQPLSELCPNRINAAHFPVTAQVGDSKMAFCDNCHAALNYDEAAAAIKSHYEAR